MPKIQSRIQLIDYALRRLGHPVIEINVDDDQVNDRIDDALQFFSEYHFDGVEKVFLKYKLTPDDIDRGYVEMKYDGTSPSRFTGQPGSVGKPEDQENTVEAGVDPTVKIEDLITSVISVWHIGTQTAGMFDIRYQYALNDLYTFGSIDLIHYTNTMQYLQLLQQLLSPEKSIRFSRRNNRLYIDTKLGRDIKADSWLIIEAYRVLDPRVYPEVYDDMHLKAYATALIKKQWAINLSKFKNVQLPGGITFNGDQLYAQAELEIKEIETTIRGATELPVDFIVG